jgi:CPA2 family monovalent cation:H+ antiporter-2
MATIAALGFSYVLSRLRMPVVLGQLLAGMIIGPFGLGLVQDLNTINLLASLGIILLMFTVGLELDPAEIRKVGPESILLAAAELTVTFVAVFAVSMLVGLTYLQSILAALVVLTTSTAIMGKLLTDTNSLRARESHYVITASIIEDFLTVLILVLLPGLVAANTPLGFLEVLAFFLKGILLTGVIFVFSWKLAPAIIDRVGKGGVESQETAFLLALSFGFGFALLSSYLGFSPAIGAFLTGMMIRGQAASFILKRVEPIKHLFIVLFFVSMGALINIGSLLTLTIPIVAVLVAGMVGKFSGAWAGTRVSFARKDATRVGISMLPRGEFSFVIAREGAVLGVMGQLLFPIAGLSTLIGSVLASLGLRLANPKPTEPPQVAHSPSGKVQRRRD